MNKFKRFILPPLEALLLKNALLSAFTVALAACSYNPSFSNLVRDLDSRSHDGFFDFSIEFPTDSVREATSSARLSVEGGEDVLNLPQGWIITDTSKTSVTFSNGLTRIKSKNKAISVPYGEYKLEILLGSPVVSLRDSESNETIFILPGEHYFFSRSFTVNDFIAVGANP